MDFRNVTRLFSDPEWDGPIEQVDGYDPNGQKKSGNKDDNGGGGTTPPIVDKPDKYIVDEKGCNVHILGKTVSVFDATLLPVNTGISISTAVAGSVQVCFEAVLPDCQSCE